ncbi:MAG: hypothetical protein LBR18_05775 [Tannerella sp.]|nr:hypothetical protein [Tannerella sp.]
MKNLLYLCSPFRLFFGGGGAEEKPTADALDLDGSSQQNTARQPANVPQRLTTKQSSLKRFT